MPLLFITHAQVLTEERKVGFESLLNSSPFCPQASKSSALMSQMRNKTHKKMKPVTEISGFLLTKNNFYTILPLLTEACASSMIK